MKALVLSLLIASTANAQSLVITDSPPRPAPVEMSKNDYQQQKRTTDALLLLQSNRIEARKILAEIIDHYERQFPTDVPHRRMSGQTDGEIEQYRKILKTYNPIIIPSPYIKAIGLMASSYLDEGDLANAETFITKAIMTAPYKSLYHTIKGNLELRKTYPAVASDSFILAIHYAGMRANDDNKALVTSIDKAMGYEGLAESVLLQGNRERAIELLKKSIAAYPQGRTAPARLKELEALTP